MGEKGPPSPTLELGGEFDSFPEGGWGDTSFGEGGWGGDEGGDGWGGDVDLDADIAAALGEDDCGVDISGDASGGIDLGGGGGISLADELQELGAEFDFGDDFGEGFGDDQVGAGDLGDVGGDIGGDIADFGEIPALGSDNGVVGEGNVEESGVRVGGIPDFESKVEQDAADLVGGEVEEESGVSVGGDAIEANADGYFLLPSLLPFVFSSFHFFFLS